MNKKILIISSIMMLLISIMFSTNVYAETLTSAEIAITPSKTEYTSGETVEFIISLKNLDASDGIMGLGAYIDYDSDLLTLNTNAEGLTNWADAKISEDTKRFVTHKNEHSSNNENILKVTFTAKEVQSNVTTSISLKNVEISNGTEYDIKEIKSDRISIKLKSSGSGNTSTNSTGETNNQNDKNQPNSQSGSNGTNNFVGFTNSSTNQNKTNNNTSTNVTTSSRLPQTGINEYLSGIIAIIGVISIVLVIKIKRINKKIINNEEK